MYKYILSGILAAGLCTAAVSCSEDNYEKGPEIPEGCISAYFASANEANILMTPVEYAKSNTLKLTVNREVSDEAASVPVIVEYKADEIEHDIGILLDGAGLSQVAQHRQIAAVTSVAGTKGMGTAPAYSATKRMQSTYIDALAQLARMRHIGIDFTDIRPGFVRTDILDSKKNYPMIMDKVPVGEAAVNAILCRRRIAVIDWRFSILTFFWSLIPQWLWERCTGITN